MPRSPWERLLRGGARLRAAADEPCSRPCWASASTFRFLFAAPGARAGAGSGRLARAAPCASHARARGLRAAGARAAHQRGRRARARPHGRLARRGAGRGLLRRACASTSTDQDDGRDDMRALIDAWWPYVERGEVEAIVITASGCGATVKEYGAPPRAGSRLPRQGGAHLGDGARILSEVVPAGRRHAARGQGRLPVALLAAARAADPRQGRGAARAGRATSSRRCADAHLCCGSAGTYSILQPALSAQLRSAQARGAARAARPPRSPPPTSAA